MVSQTDVYWVVEVFGGVELVVDLYVCLWHRSWMVGVQKAHHAACLFLLLCISSKLISSFDLFIVDLQMFSYHLLLGARVVVIKGL